MVTSSALPARTIDVEPLEPHHYSFPGAQVKDLGMIKAGETVTVRGTVSSVRNSIGSAAGSDISDYLRFRVPAGVTVTGTTQNQPTTHLCGPFPNYSTYYADIATDPFPWSNEGYLRSTFMMQGCQTLDSNLVTRYSVQLQGSRGRIYIRVSGANGSPSQVASTKGVFGLPQGTFTVQAGTDANGNGTPCEMGDFCATTTVTISDGAQKNVTLAPR